MRPRYNLMTMLCGALTLSACSDEIPPQPQREGTCAEEEPITEHGVDLIRCRRIHTSYPWIQLPVDTPTLRYVGVDPGAGLLLTHNGRMMITGQARALLDAESGSSPEAQHGDRYAHTIYAASFDDAGTLTALKPVVRVDDAVLLGYAVAGRAFEGTISALERVEDGFPRYALEPTLKVRVEVDMEHVWELGDPQHGSKNAVFKARIVNATSSVKAADGTCIPSLKDAGAGDPFPDATGPREVEFTRVPNMHGGNDDVVVVSWDDSSSNMGAELFVSPGMLLSGTAPPARYTSSPHGTPWSAPHLHLGAVPGGGGPCP